MDLTAFIQNKEAFLQHLKDRNKSQCTYRSYASDLAQFETFWHTLQLQRRAQITITQAVDEYFTSLYRNKARSQSIARKCSCLNSFKKYVQQFDTSVDFTTQRPKHEHRKPTILSREEITYLLDSLPVEEIDSRFPHRDKAILELLYATGIKPSEIVRVRMKDIYIDDYTMYVPHSHRYVFFGSKARERLISYTTYERPHDSTGYAYAFVNYQGRPLTPRSLQRICRSFSLHLSSEITITPQVLRHSFAYHLLEQGADHNTVQHLLGTKTRLTLDRYLQMLYELD